MRKGNETNQQKRNKQKYDDRKYRDAYSTRGHLLELRSSKGWRLLTVFLPYALCCCNFFLYLFLSRPKDSLDERPLRDFDSSFGVGDFARAVYRGVCACGEGVECVYQYLWRYCASLPTMYTPATFLITFVHDDRIYLFTLTVPLLPLPANGGREDAMVC